MPDPYALAAEAASAIAERSARERHDVAIVLGTGWSPAADAVGTDGVEIPFADLPGFPAPTAGGHGQAVRALDVAGRRVLVFLGRVHLYEGHEPAAVVHPVRVAAAAGCATIVLTNGAGSLRHEWAVGQPVLISDHINITGRSPLSGPQPPAPFPSRFVDLTDLYRRRLRDLARTVDPTLPEGVYIGFPGPHFETPAEIRMAAAMGADLVGMSTVLEAIAARHAGMDVLGISLATNPAAGISPEPIDPDHIVAAGREAAPRIGALLRGVVEQL